MILVTVVFSIIICINHGFVYACSIQDQKKVRIGANEGIEGTCSNNGFPISCVDLGDDEISCDGPGGGFSGYDLESLIFSACGCSSQEEKGKQLKKQVE